MEVDAAAPPPPPAPPAENGDAPPPAEAPSADPTDAAPPPPASPDAVSTGPRVRLRLDSCCFLTREEEEGGVVLVPQDKAQEKGWLTEAALASLERLVAEAAKRAPPPPLGAPVRRGPDVSGVGGEGGRRDGRRFFAPPARRGLARSCGAHRLPPPTRPTHTAT